jgi:hypothetical protein
MKRISCDRERLYARGGLYEAEPNLMEESVGRWIANVYSPYSYERPLPRHVFSKNATTPTQLLDHYESLAAAYPTGASTDLFEIRNAILYDRSLYVVVPPGELALVYETARPIDRPWRKDLDPSLLSNARRATASDLDYAYLGSVGSENYGHWLIDDLTRYKGIVEALGRNRRVGIVLERCGDPIDAIRMQSLQASTPDGIEVEVVFIEKNVPYLFEKLHYVTPSSYAPLLKAPDGVAFVDRALNQRPPRNSHSRLFVNRAAVWRNLINADEVIDFFSELSFQVICLDTHPLTPTEQATTFAGASVVVGVAGAAMANTLFCPPATRVFYLAGEGFSDPWYWDLAAVKRHEYSVCFGTPWKPKRPNFSSFTIDAGQLREIGDLL